MPDAFGYPLCFKLNWHSLLEVLFQGFEILEWCINDKLVLHRQLVELSVMADINQFCKYQYRWNNWPINWYPQSIINGHKNVSKHVIVKEVVNHSQQ